MVKKQQNGAETEANRPVQKFRLKGVTVSVFANKTEREGRNEVYHKLSLSRVYRDGEEWKTTGSLSAHDVPIARLLLDRAWQWILDAEAASRQQAET